MGFAQWGFEEKRPWFYIMYVCIETSYPYYNVKLR